MPFFEDSKRCHEILNYTRVSKNGLLTTSIFHDWFQKFVCKVYAICMPNCVYKYKISRLDKVKMKNYNLWKANSAPVDEDRSPVLTTENESDRTTLVNTSDVESSLLNSAITSSVADAPSPQGKKSCKKLPFSTQSYSEALSSSSLCATPAQENKGQSCST